MAKSKQIKMSQADTDFIPPSSARNYKGELPPQAKLDEGDAVAGFFVSMKTITIKDQNTREDKDVRVYTFSDKQDKKFAILGRTMLDHAFDDVAEHEGGIEGMKGMIVRIERGEDTPLKGGRTLGNYAITCWEAGDE